MTHSSRWLLVLGVSALTSGANLFAQDDLEALLEDLGGDEKAKPAVVAPAKTDKPEAKEKKEEAKPAEKKVEKATPQPKDEKVVKQEPAPVPEVKKEEEPAPVPEVKAEDQVAEQEPAPVPEVKKEEEPAPVPEVKAEDQVAEQKQPAVAKPAEPPMDKETATLLSELETLEKIRRKSLDDHGFSALTAARRDMEEKKFAAAAREYLQALKFIGNRPANLKARDEARKGCADALYMEACRLAKEGDREEATVQASKAKEAGHPLAQRLIEALKRETVAAKTPKDTSKISHRVNEKEHKALRTETRRRLRRSRQFYTTGELDKALEECELILRDYPFDKDAMELRDRIADRMKDVSDLEFEATRSMMIRNVRDTWNDKRYAIDSDQLPHGKGELTTKKTSEEIASGRTTEQLTRQKLLDIVIPEVSFRPPATIIDAVDFFKIASRDYDKPEIPVEQRGVNLVLKLPAEAAGAAGAGVENGGGAADDPFAETPDATSAPAGVPVIPAMTARFINLFDALKLVCDVTGMKFRIRGNIVMIVPANEPDSELITRSYNVLASLTDRIQSAQSEMSSNRSSDLGGGQMETADMGQQQDWKAFFTEMGVAWPEGSSIAYISTIGKLRVKNTAEQLAAFEQVLEDLNVTPRLIEIEARFVEVSQNDLNSLGFEWLLNSDFSFDAGGFLDKALNLREHSNKATALYDKNGNVIPGSQAFLPYQGPGRFKYQQGSFVDGVDRNGDPINKPFWKLNNGSYYHQKMPYYQQSDSPYLDAYGNQLLTPVDGKFIPTFGDGFTAPAAGQYGMVNKYNHNMSIDQNNFTTGNRFLNVDGNPITGKDGSPINDQFMRINAFLGNADLSVILHMLSQRSDTDVLSAPKVVTKNGSEAIMKVVTEYIYPTEFEVELSEQGGGGGNNGNYSTGIPLATVEPQNFETREVGVILQVLPEVSPEGQMINLMLNPQVISEPTWKNYGMKIPYYRPNNSSLTTLQGVSDQVQQALLMKDPEDDLQWMEVPMEQPFFSVRSVSTQLSVYNGATVVMGGLITEERTTIEDKIPFLGDIPYLGRIFRSKAESSNKRNLLVFVTARLVDLAGRPIKAQGESSLMQGMEGSSAGTPATGGAAASPAADAAVAEAPAADGAGI